MAGKEGVGAHKWWRDLASDQVMHTVYGNVRVHEKFQPDTLKNLDDEELREAIEFMMHLHMQYLGFESGSTKR